ncbi:PIN domain-containing protein [uncultured Sphingomonas sp.]|uniref:PIN domain-containing protein n=1 Tax=uncultured Sphingomonas sp. TaxID=158754 RepID=UPI0035CB7465
MILDANVLVSAVIGNSFALIATIQQSGHDLFVPTEQFREAELNGLRLAGERGMNAPLLVSLVLNLVQPVETALYQRFEQAARQRLDSALKAQKDWPLLALALATGDAIWTNDKDLFGTGVVTWKTINIQFAQAATSPPEVN